MVKASATYAPSDPESKIEAIEMDAFNDELVKAGVRLAPEGLHNNSGCVRVQFDGKHKTFVDGPFAETKELVAGFWIWEVKSMAEAVEWIKRSPFRKGEVELRPIHGPDDFTPRDPTGEARKTG
jgi:hypothetical protein